MSGSRLLRLQRRLKSGWFRSGAELPGESRTGAGSANHRLDSDSPTNNNNTNNNNNLDPNNAAYLALRNHPETTIRPVNSEMRSENEEASRNLEDNIFKQVGRRNGAGRIQK